MPITTRHRDLLSHHKANYTSGLTSAEAGRRRNENAINTGSGGLNAVTPPINCPKWICCLLPCINHIPSLKLFKAIQPDDAEVLRDGKWIRYDHASLVVGDVVRLVEGDAVPADCVIVNLGMELVDVTEVVDDNGESSEVEGATDGSLEMTVDSHYITGESKPRQISSRPNGTIDITTLYFGSRILEGSCIALVTATGNEVILAKLIKEGRWPPQGDLSEEAASIAEMSMKGDREGVNHDDLEAGISLLPRS